MQSQTPRRCDEHLSHSEWTCRREWVRLIVLQEHIVFVATDASDPFDLGEIWAQLVVGDRPVDHRAAIRNQRLTPAFQRVRPQPEAMSRKPAQPPAIVDHGSADAVDHATKRERQLPRCLRLVAAPAWRLAFEFGAQLSPAVVGARQLVRPEVLPTPERPCLQPDNLQASSRQHWGDKSAHTSDTDQDYIGPIGRRRCSALGIEAGDWLVALLLQRL